MKRLFLLTVLFSLAFAPAFAQGAGAEKAKIVLLISEQNIESPRSAWWAGEVDLSAAESAIAGKLIEAGYYVMEPGEMEQVIKKDRAFRIVAISDKSSIKLASAAKADYVVSGKAIASAGGNVPQSNMRSCFANITVKLIDAKTGKVLAYLDAAGNSAHMDVISGGREALVSAGRQAADKIILKLDTVKGSR